MSDTKKRARRLQDLRHLHRTLAPIMLIPIVLTLVTGVFYEIADLFGQGDVFDWLLDLHKGNFHILNLEIVYPFLNGLGLLALVYTGFSMWMHMRRMGKSRS